MISDISIDAYITYESTVTGDDEYDLIVIGSGGGAFVAAIRARGYARRERIGRRR